MSATSPLKKRSLPSSDATLPDVTGEPPYVARARLLEHYAKQAGSTYVVWHLSEDILELIPGKLEELGVDEVDVLNADQRLKAYKSLSQDQVDQYHHCMVVPRSVCELQSKLYDEIMYSDNRNQQESSVVMLDTHSSACMYPVIQKQLTAATREINKAMRAIAAGKAGPGVASNAFQQTVATIFACDECDHWRVDTDSLEACVKVSRKVQKVLKELLWFEDDELGLVDPFSRKALLYKLERLGTEWNEVGGVKFKTAKNGQGMGRLAALTTGPACKKLKTPMITTTADNTIAPYLYDFQQSDRFKRRVHTQLQLKISSVETPSQSALVVVSGATDLKKLNQLCAYITGHTFQYEYHSQRGFCLKGTRMQLELDNEKMWLSEHSLKKRALASGAFFSHDKACKIVQIFQGLTTGQDTGIVYDSPQARRVRLYWISPSHAKYAIEAQCIVPSKCVHAKKLALPRLVLHMETHIPNAKTGFGKGIYAANRQLQGDRQGPHYKFLDVSFPEMKQSMELDPTKPLCEEDGTGVFREGSFARYTSGDWKKENVESAGIPPTMATLRTMLMMWFCMVGASTIS